MAFQTYPPSCCFSEGVQIFAPESAPGAPVTGGAITCTSLHDTGTMQIDGATTCAAIHATGILQVDSAASLDGATSIGTGGGVSVQLGAVGTVSGIKDINICTSTGYNGTAHIVDGGGGGSVVMGPTGCQLFINGGTNGANLGVSGTGPISIGGSSSSNLSIYTGTAAGSLHIADGTGASTTTIGNSNSIVNIQSSTTRFTNGAPAPISAGGLALGTTTLPWSSLVFGASATAGASALNFLNVTSATLTNAALKTMNTTPILCIAAPAAGSSIVLITARLILNFNAAFTGGTGGLINMQYGAAAAGAAASGTIAGTFFTGAAANQWTIAPTGTTTAPTNVQTDGIAVYIWNGTGNFTGGGTSTCTLKLTYQIESTL